MQFRLQRYVCNASRQSSPSSTTFYYGLEIRQICRNLIAFTGALRNCSTQVYRIGGAGKLGTTHFKQYLHWLIGDGRSNVLSENKQKFETGGGSQDWLQFVISLYGYGHKILQSKVPPISQSELIYCKQNHSSYRNKHNQEQRDILCNLHQWGTIAHKHRGEEQSKGQRTADASPIKVSEFDRLKHVNRLHR